VIDDIEISAVASSLDGVGGTLAQAGPDALRATGSRLPYLGSMQFDTSDIQSMIDDGTFYATVLHEIAHVLGLGTTWVDKLLVQGVGTANPMYVGPGGLREYVSLTAAAATGVPVENMGGSGTVGSHWRESVFQFELMTGFAETSGIDQRLSRMTVAALEDLGYSVFYAAADPYSLPGAVSDVTTVGFDLDPAGDGILAYQGEAPGSGMAGNWVAAFSTSTFLASGPVTTGRTYLPTALASGSASFSLGLPVGPDDHNAALKDLGTVAGTPQTIRGTIASAANWTTYVSPTATGGATIPSGTLFDATVSTPAPSGTLGLTGVLAGVAATYGSASGTSSITITGSNLSTNVTATVPAGFEVSSDNVTFGPTAVYVPTGGSLSGTLYVRLAATAAAGTYAGDVTVSSIGANTTTAAMPSSTVSPKALTITGLAALAKTYDGTTAATLSGAAALFGKIGSDDVAVAGTAAGTFATKNVGTGRQVTVGGLSLSGSKAGNYTLSPLVLSADITAKQLTVRADDKTKWVTTANPPLTATITGFVAGETAATALTGDAAVSTTATAGSPAGDYGITATQGTLAALGGNYTFQYAAGTLKVLANKAPTDLALSATTVAEGLASGTLVGTLSTVDADAGDTFSYAFVSGDTSAFTIVGNELRTSQVLAFATKSVYSVRVRSTDQGSLSAEKTFTITVIGKPAAPTSVAATAGDAQATLSWTAPASNGAAITDYLVEYSSNAGSSWSTFAYTPAKPPAASVTVTGLVNGLSYIFRVSALNAAGTGSASANSAAVTPRGAPGAATAVAGTPGNGQVSLTWTAPASNGGAAITDYVVQYSSNNGVSWTTFNDGVSAAASATVKALSNGTSYVFRVAAKNALGTGNYSIVSPPVSPRTVPGVPTAVVSSPDNGQVSLQWVAPAATGGAAITDYVVQYSSNAGATWTTFADGMSTAASVVVTGLSNGTGYVFRVAAVNAAGTGGFSAATAATTPRTVPGVPTAVSGTAGNGQVSLKWTAPPSNGGVAITDYVVQYSVNGGASWAIYNDGTSTGTSATVKGLTNGTAYTFRVAAKNVAGTGGFSVASAVVTPRTVPGVPTAVVGTAGNGLVSLAWAAPSSDGGAAIVDYVVQYSANNGSTWKTFSRAASAATVATVTGLANGTNYVFRVAAVNAAGTGAYTAKTAAVKPHA